MSSNEIWLIAEIREGALTRTTLQLLAAGRRLAEEKGLLAAAVLLGGTQTLAAELAQKAPLVLHVQEPGLEPYGVQSYLSALGQIIAARGTPAAVIAAATSSGLEYMPRLAARLGAAYASFCVDLWWEGDDLACRRPVHGGKAYEDLVLLAGPALVTVRPGAFAAAENLAAPGTIESPAVELPEKAALHLVERKKTSSAKKDLAEAVCVVAGGRGMGSAENFKLLEELAALLDAAVGASRAVVDAGWRPHDEQVGKSGKTIAPELYIACGISGAIHHVLGMNSAKVVVAVNNDPGALIFEHADFGLVADVKEALPALTDALQSFLDKK